MSKRKVGGWVLFSLGIWLGLSTLIGIPKSIIYYGGADIRVGLEALLPAILAFFLIWGGWKLAHPKPKPIYTDWSELPPPMERQPTADMEQQDRKKRTTNFCPNCGVKLAEESTYCPNCGRKLEGSSN
jgi:hypothetical protein